MSIYISKNGTLYHHGIKGQKWGQRNGPPYPLENQKEKINLTDKQKKYIKMGLIIVGSSLAIYGSYKLIENRELLNHFVRSGQEKIQGFTTKTPIVNNDLDVFKSKKEWDIRCYNSDFKSLKDVPTYDKSNLYRSDGKINRGFLLNNINPGYPNELGSQNNCFMTSANLALRMKGYYAESVKAKDLNEGYPSILYTELFKGCKQEPLKYRTKEAVFNSLISGGEGSYGILDIKYKNSESRHGLFYYIEDGRINLLDGQIQKALNLDIFFNRVDTTDLCYYKLNDCDPTEKVLGAIKKT